MWLPMLALQLPLLYTESKTIEFETIALSRDWFRNSTVKPKQRMPVP